MEYKKRKEIGTGWPLFKVLDSEMKTLGSTTQLAGRCISEYRLRYGERLRKVSEWELGKWYDAERDPDHITINRNMTLYTIPPHYEEQVTRVFVAEGKGPRVPDWCESIRLIAEISAESLASLWKLYSELADIRNHATKDAYATCKVVRKKAREMVKQAEETLSLAYEQADEAYRKAVQPLLEKMAQEVTRES